MVDGEESASSTAPVDTSSTPAPAETPASSPPSTPASTETSTDTGTSKESLLDAVLKVVPATNESDVLAKTDDAVTPETDAADSQQAEDDPETDDDDEPPSNDVPAATRKKINKLLKQRREYRAEIAQLKPAAEIGSELQTFAQEHNLTGGDLAQLLHLGATLRAGDYKAFYQAIAPYVRTAQEVLGVVLPKDLQDMVRNGQMTETAAKAYARDRISGKRAEYNLQETQVAQERNHVASVQNGVKRAIANFERSLSASDPDYKAKAPVVRRVAQGMLLERGNTISSVQEALEISKAAYEEVNRQMRSFRPPPVATNPRPNGASQSPSARAVPKTMMEAALQGLEQSRRG